MIRPTEPKDTEALIEIAHGSGMFKPLDLSALGERLKEYHGREKARGHLAITYENESVPIGFAYYFPRDGAERIWSLDWIAVDIRFQRRGLGTKLLTQAEADIRRRRGRILLIETSSQPHHGLSHAFCRKLGYEELSVLQDYYDDGDDMIVYGKRILPRGHAAPASHFAETVSLKKYEIHPAALDGKTLAAQCSTRFTRRSGPGGQHRNKVETAVVVVHRPTGLGAEGSEERSQAENLKAAMFRLRLNLALKVRTERDPENTPSPLWRSRCPDGHILVSIKHEDYPTILAEALDVLHALDQDVKSASTLLACTSSQILKLLKSEHRAFLQINEERRRKSLHPLV